MLHLPIPTVLTHRCHLLCMMGYFLPHEICVKWISIQEVVLRYFLCIHRTLTDQQVKDMGIRMLPGYADPYGDRWVHVKLATSTKAFNPFTPESDQRQNSPAAWQEFDIHTVWRTWLFIAYSGERWLYQKFSLHPSYNCFLKGWENTLFELRSESTLAHLDGHFVFRSLKTHMTPRKYVFDVTSVTNSHFSLGRLGECTF